MKNLLLISLVFLSKIGYSQDEKFNGIGVFKIGTDTSVVYNYAAEGKVKVKAISNMTDLLSIQYGGNNKLQIIREYHNNQRFKDDVSLSYCPDVQEFLITKYEVAGIAIKKIKLKYYQNKLIMFNCDYSQDINIAMDTKYGKSELKVKTDTVNCLYNITGITQKLVAKTFENKWINGDISAVSFLYETYDEHCKKNINDFFYYSISDKAAFACDRESHIKHMNDAQPKISKDKIKDF